LIPNIQQNFPPPETPITDQSGKFTQLGRFFMLALFNRTGGNTGVALTVGEGLTAAGSSQTDALALADDINEIITADSGTGVGLFAMQPGMLQIVFNGGSNALSVYPASGYAIDALAADAAYSLPASKTQIFICYGQTQIRTVHLG
jgi:hypothetical protein